MAHMVSTASVGDWKSTLSRTKLICAILYDNLRAHCDGPYTWINGEWQRITSFDERHIATMEADCKMAIRFYISDDEGGNCSDAISNLARRVKEFRESGLSADAIEKAG